MTSEVLERPELEKLAARDYKYGFVTDIEAPEEPRRGRSRAPRDLREAGHPAARAGALAGVAVDAVFDSVSVATTFKDKLARRPGVIFCSFSEAVQRAPRAGAKYLGSVVPVGDNFFAALNSAVFSDGSFVYIPKGVRCPMELSTYFRINAPNTGQFERTLIVAEEGRARQLPRGLHRADARREPAARRGGRAGRARRREIKYSTVQNWYPGDEDGKGGIYNFVTKRGNAAAAQLQDLLDAGRDRLGHHLEVPELHPAGRRLGRRVLLGGVTNNHQQADTGTKMIHIGRNTRSTIVSKGISAGHGQNTYRGLVKILPAPRARATTRSATRC
jgi:Fe-S cluster assembly protein SufB